MSEKLQLALPAEKESLPAIRKFIEDACGKAGLDGDTSFDVKLAVDEACMNIVEHGYAGMDPGSLIVSLQYGARQMVVRITDFGHPFEPEDGPPPDPEEAAASDKLGGFGVYFIHRSMDSVTYQATESGNTLTLVKNFQSATNPATNKE